MKCMGRLRQHDRHLPPRMRLRGRSYYHVHYLNGQQKWFRLSADYGEALRLYYQREGVQPSGSTVGDALTRYEIEILPTKAEATQREYARYIKRLREVFGDSRLIGGVRRSDVAQYLDRRSAKIEGNREIACLSSVYRSAITWGWCDENPCAGAPRNSEKTKPKRAPTDQELSAIQLAASKQMQCMIELVLIIGLRKTDLLKIRLSDLTDKGLRVKVQKTGVEVLFTWTDALRDVVERAKKLRRRVGSLYLFATREDGQQYTTSGFDSNWQRLLKKAKVKITFHSLRRWAITQAKRTGGMDYAQTIGAHKSRQATEKYISEPEIVVRPLR